ncbi:hypothetical protein ACFYPN_15750 [Streptomyces sp. NPDC005576]|uniref:hypothetical protein n=1 Tax=unclassified Streptomyces TaxID=2593676 RepID=UPI0033D80A00
MAATPDRTARRLALLAALVTQRRTSLHLGIDEAARLCDLAPMTYRRVEGGKDNEGASAVRATSYAKVETGLGLVPGSCIAVLKGADSIKLVDGGELIAGAQITRPSRDQIASELRDAVSKVAGLHAPELTHGQTDKMTADLMKELQKRGVLPPSR